MRPLGLTYANVMATVALFIALGGTPTPTPTPEGWTFCANEWERCVFTGTQEVRYGANGTYTALRTFTDGVECTNAVFGDPLPGVFKHCDRRLLPTTYPASFTTGPLGTRNPLPPKNPGALLGLWGPGTDDGTTGWPQIQQGIVDREAYIGRKFDWIGIHYAAPTDQCHWGVGHRPFAEGREQWVHNRGQLAVVNWTHGWTADAVNAGTADACIREVARNAAALPFTVLLRIYWEFDGTWFRWSATGQKFIDMWRRTVRLFQEEGATNVGFVWSPAWRDDNASTGPSYPGDSQVDWIGVSTYNWNNPDAWCSPFGSGWCEFAHVVSHDPVNYPTIYDKYADRKPFGSFETGTVEDPQTPGRKAQWFRDQIPTRIPKVRALLYFDMNFMTNEGINWRLDTSSSSLEGFRDLALSPFFRTQPSQNEGFGWPLPAPGM